MFQIRIAIKNYSPYKNIKNRVVYNTLAVKYWLFYLLKYRKKSDEILVKHTILRHKMSYYGLRIMPFHGIMLRGKMSHFRTLLISYEKFSLGITH